MSETRREKAYLKFSDPSSLSSLQQAKINALFLGAFTQLQDRGLSTPIGAELVHQQNCVRLNFLFDTVSYISDQSDLHAFLDTEQEIKRVRLGTSAKLWADYDPADENKVTCLEPMRSETTPHNWTKENGGEGPLDSLLSQIARIRHKATNPLARESNGKLNSMTEYREEQLLPPVLVNLPKPPEMTPPEKEQD